MPSLVTQAQILGVVTQSVAKMATANALFNLILIDINNRSPRQLDAADRYRLVAKNLRFYRSQFDLLGRCRIHDLLLHHRAFVGILDQFILDRIDSGS